MKKIIIILFIIIIVGVGIASLLLASTNGNTVKTESTDPVDYQACAEDGGDVSTDIAPSRCTINGKNYYDGDF